MGHTNSGINIFQVPLAELVKVDTSHVTISKMGMLCHYGFNTEELCRNQYLSHGHTGAQMTVTQVNMFSD